MPQERELSDCRAAASARMTFPCWMARWKSAPREAILRDHNACLQALAAYQRQSGRSRTIKAFGCLRDSRRARPPPGWPVGVYLFGQQALRG